MLPLYLDPHFTFRFAEERICPRFRWKFVPVGWRDRTHFVFWFHDSTFECVARSYKVETHRTRMKALLGLLIERLIS